MTTFHYPSPERVPAQSPGQTPGQTPAQSPEQGLAHNSPFAGIDSETLRALANVAQGPSQADNLLQGENITSDEEQLTQAKADLEAFASQLYPDTDPNNTQPRQDFIAGFRIETQDDQAVIIPIDPNTNQPIENFKLSISGRGLTGELLLPHQMQISVLHCPDNQLTSLPAQLPAGLTELWCSRNQLPSLPDLPDSLTALYCHINQLTSLPNQLPDSLTILDCYNNQLTSLPDQLPAGLTVLDCSDNQLPSLPDLPASLTELYCTINLS